MGKVDISNLKNYSISDISITGDKLTESLYQKLVDSIDDAKQRSKIPTPSQLTKSLKSGLNIPYVPNSIKQEIYKMFIDSVVDGKFSKGDLSDIINNYKQKAKGSNKVEDVVKSTNMVDRYLAYPILNKRIMKNMNFSRKGRDRVRNTAIAAGTIGTLYGAKQWKDFVDTHRFDKNIMATNPSDGLKLGPPRPEESDVNNEDMSNEVISMDNFSNKKGSLAKKLALGAGVVGTVAAVPYATGDYKTHAMYRDIMGDIKDPSFKENIPSPSELTKGLKEQLGVPYVPNSLKQKVYDVIDDSLVDGGRGVYGKVGTSINLVKNLNGLLNDASNAEKFEDFVKPTNIVDKYVAYPLINKKIEHEMNNFSNKKGSLAKKVVAGVGLGAVGLGAAVPVATGGYKTHSIYRDIIKNLKDEDVLRELRTPAQLDDYLKRQLNIGYVPHSIKQKIYSLIRDSIGEDGKIDEVKINELAGKLEDASIGAEHIDDVVPATNIVDRYIAYPKYNEQLLEGVYFSNKNSIAKKVVNGLGTTVGGAKHLHNFSNFTDKKSLSKKVAAGLGAGASLVAGAGSLGLAGYLKNDRDFYNKAASQMRDENETQGKAVSSVEEVMKDPYLYSAYRDRLLEAKGNPEELNKIYDEINSNLDYKIPGTTLQGNIGVIFDIDNFSNKSNYKKEKILGALGGVATAAGLAGSAYYGNQIPDAKRAYDGEFYEGVRNRYRQSIHDEYLENPEKYVKAFKESYGRENSDTLLGKDFLRDRGLSYLGEGKLKMPTESEGVTAGMLKRQLGTIDGTYKNNDFEGEKDITDKWKEDLESAKQELKYSRDWDYSGVVDKELPRIDPVVAYFYSDVDNEKKKIFFSDKLKKGLNIAAGLVGVGGAISSGLALQKNSEKNADLKHRYDVIHTLNQKIGEENKALSRITGNPDLYDKYADEYKNASEERRLEIIKEVNSLPEDVSTISMPINDLWGATKNFSKKSKIISALGTSAALGGLGSTIYSGLQSNKLLKENSQLIEELGRPSLINDGLRRDRVAYNVLLNNPEAQSYIYKKLTNTLDENQSLSKESKDLLLQDVTKPTKFKSLNPISDSLEKYRRSNVQDSLVQKDTVSKEPISDNVIKKDIVSNEPVRFDVIKRDVIRSEANGSLLEDSDLTDSEKQMLIRDNFSNSKSPIALPNGKFSDDYDAARNPKWELLKQGLAWGAGVAAGSIALRTAVHLTADAMGAYDFSQKFAKRFGK